MMYVFRRLSILISLSGVIACSPTNPIGSPASYPPLDPSRYDQVRGMLAPEEVVFPVLPSPKLEIRPEVVRAITWYQKRDPRYIPLALERGRPFYGKIARIFRRYGIPRELIQVAIVESGFRPSARSRAGAVGLWQFMRATARVYGLGTRWPNDERKDIVASTEAAAKHLRYLFQKYQDWALVLAAYNAGEGAVNRAVRRVGSRNFWDLVEARALRAQTRQYVPKFIAINLILKDPSSYGFDRRCSWS